ncbi:putative monooxygenase [Corchorus capsularis]|uniref:Putative monooxygenase n=1 Tax=Corchorus capsularis TaxID=210143 RepID=A0A1R3JJD6_COCAP|nr:putative monooxygenase [Corchorus capsularis]
MGTNETGCSSYQNRDAAARGGVVGVVVVAPGEDGGFDAEVGDGGGEVGGRAVGENGNEAKVEADLDGESIELMEGKTCF